jgi:GH18 family chitinase
VKRPGDLIVDPLTHLNLAFVNFGSNWQLSGQYDSVVAEAALLKLRYPGLRINIAIGGWSFNDPPTATYFSQSILP